MDQQLIQQLQDNHGITEEQSHGILNTIEQFIKDKVPMATQYIEQALHGGNSTATPIPTNPTTTVPAGHEESTLEKIEDFAKSKLEGLLPGGIKI